MLLKTIEWLVETKRFARDKLPIQSGRKRYLINDRPIHQSGEKFRDPKVIAGFYVECNLSITSILRYTERLLEIFDINTSEVRLV